MSTEKIFFDIQGGNLSDAKATLATVMSERIDAKKAEMKKEIAGTIYKESADEPLPEKGTTSICEGAIPEVDKLKAVQRKAKSVPVTAPDLKDGDNKTIDKAVPAPKSAVKEGTIDESEGIYHESYRGALEHAYGKAKAKGYDIHGEDYHKDTSFVDPKPANGSTKRLSFPLSKGGVVQKKQMHVQVYNRGADVKNRYELNHYIS
jgi:hypothetical protein